MQNRAIADLKAQGVAYCTMLTGDNPARAAAVAAEVGLDGYEAGLLPGDKLAAAEKLKERGKVLYAGDGINDAPVMAAADCAVSMGKVGSDAAIEASDLVLVTDNLELLPKGKKIAKGTRRIVFQNIVGLAPRQARRYGARHSNRPAAHCRGRGRRGRNARGRAQRNAHQAYKINRIQSAAPPEFSAAPPVFLYLLHAFLSVRLILRVSQPFDFTKKFHFAQKKIAHTRPNVVKY